MSESTHSSSSALLFLAMLLGAGTFGLWPMLPGGDPPDGIDLAQAQADVALVAARPHPLGSAANREVRDQLETLLTDLGLEVEIQVAELVYDHPNREERHVRAARVENLLARLPGEDPAETALVVMSHYDSRPDGPGAGDAAAGVAAVLAAARSLAQGPTPARDVWFVLTDGEEMGLFGAQAFFRQHPAASRVGLVLNFEARGSAGPSMLFETGPDNGALIASAASVISPVGTSMAYEIYRFMPNDTDLTISKSADIPGLNFAFADQFFDYHTEGDRPDVLSPRSLGEHVHHAVALSRHFAHLDALPPPSSNRSFILNPPPGVSFSYGPVVAWVIALLALALTLRVVARERGRWVRPPLELLRALVALILTILIVSHLIESLHDGLTGQSGFSDPRFWHWFYRYPIAMAGYALLALAGGCWLMAAWCRGLSPSVLTGLPLLVAAGAFLAGRFDAIQIGFLVIMAALLWWYRRPLAPGYLAAAGLVLWALLALVMQIALPTASFMFALPLLWVAGVASLVRQRPVLADAAGLLAPMIIWGPALYGLYLMVGVQAPQIPAASGVLLLSLVAGSATAIGASWRGAIVGGLAVGGLLILGQIATQGEAFDARYSQPTELYLVHDAGSFETYWASGDPTPNAWTTAVLGDQPGQRSLEELLPGLDRPVWFNPVDQDLTDPRIEVREDRIEGDRRFLGLTVTSPRQAEYINLLVSPDTTLRGAAINDLPVPVPEDLGEEEWWRWRLFGLGQSPIEVDLITEANQPVALRLIEVAYHWPETLQPPERPAAFMRRPYAWSDSTVVYTDLNLDAGQP